MTSPAVSRKPVAPPRARLTLVEARLPSDPFLLTYFENFYCVLVDCKSKHATHAPGAPVSEQPGEIHEQLRKTLVEQEEEVFESGTLLGVEMYRQAQRVMACLADEIFSAAPWSGKDSWQSLEVELFESDRQYGLAIDGPCMKKLDPLLQQDDPAYRELAAVYFYALALADGKEDASERYRQPLLQMIGSQNGKATDHGRVFEQSYAHTLTENKVAALPSAQRWWLGLALIILAWFSLSWLVWHDLSSPIENELQQIRQTMP